MERPNVSASHTNYGHSAQSYKISARSTNPIERTPYPKIPLYEAELRSLGHTQDLGTMTDICHAKNLVIVLITMKSYTIYIGDS